MTIPSMSMRCQMQMRCANPIKTSVNVAFTIVSRIAFMFFGVRLAVVQNSLIKTLDMLRLRHYDMDARLLLHDIRYVIVKTRVERREGF
jgi:hypothetical protein